MPYFKQLNLLYIHVPKTGGMSIETYLYEKCNMEANEKNIYGYFYDRNNGIRVENERTLQHLTYTEIIQRKNWFDIDETPEMKILVSVRNPFDRILSEIFWNKKTGATEQSTPEEIYQILYNYLYVDTSFIDNHKTPQYQFILNENLLTIKKNIYFVHTENLIEDMKSCGFSDFDVHTNMNTVTKNDYIKYFNADAIELITTYYAADFIHFGYSTDINNRQYTPRTPAKILPLKIHDHQYKGTIVTAFMRDINKYRVTSDYIAFGEKLLSISVPKIVFIDRSSYKEFFENKSFPLTEFILFELTDMYLHELRPYITDFTLETNNPDKDTLEYIFVQCYKTEWLRTATEKNPFNTEQFIWSDFGIYHMIKDEALLDREIKRMCNCSYDRLRIATCKHREYVTPYCVYKRLTWCFAGSIVGGDIKSVIAFADIVKEKIVDTIHTRHCIMWELCIWYLIKDVIPELYDCYICGHDFRILELY
jgi:hypothetical protein